MQRLSQFSKKKIKYIFHWCLKSPLYEGIIWKKTVWAHSLNNSRHFVKNLGFFLICQSTTSMYSVLKICKVWWNIKEWKMIKLETNEANLSMRQTWFCEKDSLVSS